ncbi:hypothetical protein WJX74_004323 [Apatococcus lobatus]|uniref:phosphoserine phosphatase n=1 Tax=Apatococcus lobatus TaxID=904363 RepID=A0AAW1SEL2_9CHLO
MDLQWVSEKIQEQGQHPRTVYQTGARPNGQLCPPRRAGDQTRSSLCLGDKQSRELWKRADAVCFDVDSTLCTEESIDELASFLGVGEIVAEATARAMQGDLPFEESLDLRLGLMQPSSDQVQEYSQARPLHLSPDVAGLIDKLQNRGTKIFLVSGGFRAIIHPIAEALRIPIDHVYANTILFKEDGSYAGFDHTELTSRSRGKHAAAVAIKEQHGSKSLVMIGDGATDLEARQEGGADMFVGYGGVVRRPNIAAAADWYIDAFGSLLEAL